MIIIFAIYQEMKVYIKRLYLFEQLAFEMMRKKVVSFDRFYQQKNIDYAKLFN